MNGDPASAAATAFAGAADAWRDLARGWRAVLLGLALTAAVELGLAVPW